MPRIRSLLLGIGRWFFKSTEMNSQVVVASSGWNQDGWEEFPNGSVLVVDMVGQEKEFEKISFAMYIKYKFIQLSWTYGK